MKTLAFLNQIVYYININNCTSLVKRLTREVGDLKVTTILKDTLDSCYAVSRIHSEEYDYLLVASETENACFAYDLNHQLEKTVVWDSVGGTMSIIQIPGTMDFLATQRFYPGFNAKECRIVYGKFNQGQWDIQPMMNFPYLHRFDLIKGKDGRLLFVGCTIANSKEFIEDWSDKGKIFTGVFDRESLWLEELKALPLRLLKNHGYYDVKEEGYSLITAVEGILKLSYPDVTQSKNWELDLLFNEETSDVTQIDINGDGKKENLIIQGFHGDKLRILSDNFEEEIYCYPEKTPFGHAIWSGYLLGKPYYVFGWRSGIANLITLTVEDGEIVEQLIDADSASSNCLAFEKNNEAFIFSANNGRNEVKLYKLEGE